jgi:hypothetical protein
MIEDYDAAIGLWKTDAGFGLSTADNKEIIAQFLRFRDRKRKARF